MNNFFCKCRTQADFVKHAQYITCAWGPYNIQYIYWFINNFINGHIQKLKSKQLYKLAKLGPNLKKIRNNTVCRYVM